MYTNGHIFVSAIVMCETETKLLQTAESDYSSLKKCNETLGDCCVTLKRYQKAIEYYENMLKVYT